MLLGFIVLVHLLAVIAVSDQTFRDTIYVNEGEQFTLPCKNETPGMYIGIVWKEQATQLYTRLRSYGLNIHDRIYKRSRLVKDTSLQIDHAIADDAGIYKCNLLYRPNRLKFPHAVIPSVIKVIVSVKPNITLLNPDTQYRSAGQEAYIRCSFNAVPSANVTWRFDGSRDIAGKYTTHGNTSVLHLRKVRRKDTGYYTCSAANRAGIDEQRAYIKVMYTPRIIYITSQPHIDVGKNGTITCKARGFPLPDMYWQFMKGHSFIDLRAEEAYGGISVSATKQDLLEEWSESVLTIKSAEVEDLQVNFTCLAANDEGARYEVVNVKGATKPAQPEVTVEPMSPRKVLVKWSIIGDGGSRIFEYTLQYSLYFGNGSVQGWVSKYVRPGNLSSFLVADLKPSTQYLFRISAKNIAGWSDFSDSVVVLTHGETLTNHDGKDGTVIPNRQGSKAPDSNSSGVFGDLGLAGICGIVGGGLLFVIIFFAIICLVIRQKPASSQTTSVFGSRPVSVDNGSLAPPEGRRPSEMPSETTEFIPLLTRADQWEFPRDRLRLSTLLGSGAFGTVVRGDAQGIRGSAGSVKVAVKIAKDDDNRNATKDLHAELGVLKLLPEHPNVVGLLGCCTRIEPLMIIVEYCAHGDLQGFLRSSRGISESYYKSKYHPIGRKMTSKMLLTFALQIAKGMSHLAAFKIIHRDLAARNVLVNEDLVCKISDFGFARDIYVEDQYMKKSKGGRFPIKWMALESLLDGISTPKSDVWAFGVVLWEIVTLGASPYPGMNSYEVVSFLQDGFRMDKPKHCSDELYAVSMTCWNVAPQRRPTFEELASMLADMLEEDKEFINMNFYQDHLYENFDVNLACQSSAHGSGIELNSSEATPLRLNAVDTAIAISS